MTTLSKLSEPNLATLAQNGYNFVLRNHDYRILATRFIDFTHAQLGFFLRITIHPAAKSMTVGMVADKIAFQSKKHCHIANQLIAKRKLFLLISR